MNKIMQNFGQWLRDVFSKNNIPTLILILIVISYALFVISMMNEHRKSDQKVNRMLVDQCFKSTYKNPYLTGNTYEIVETKTVDGETYILYTPEGKNIRDLNISMSAKDLSWYDECQKNETDLTLEVDK